MANFWTSEGFEPPQESGVEPTNRWQRKLWHLMEEPESSTAAKFYAGFSITMIVMWVLKNM